MVPAHLVLGGNRPWQSSKIDKHRQYRVYIYQFAQRAFAHIILILDKIVVEELIYILSMSICFKIVYHNSVIISNEIQMSLITGFRHGESLSDAGDHFTVDTDARCLHATGGAVRPLSGTDVSPIPGVRVRVADRQRWPGMLSLAFEAPRDVLLLRRAAAAGDVL